MVAAPFKVSLIAALGGPNGKRKVFTMTGSDVANEYLLFDSGSSEVTLNKNDVYIVDMIYTAAGTDTTNDQLFIGGTTDGTKLFRATSTGTIVMRPLQSSPIRVPGGTSVKFKQLA